MMSGLREECGVFGAYDLDGGDVAELIYYGMYALQHRGQQSCGIAVNYKRETTIKKGKGLISENLDHDKLKDMKGNMGVGHVRYPSQGQSGVENNQPIAARYIKGNLTLSHNGSLVNADELRNELTKNGAVFQTYSDAEIMLYLIARERLKQPNVENAVAEALSCVKGAYSLLVMSPEKLVATRDPFGYRPLCIGKRKNIYFIASESCALDAVGAEFIRDIEPGEVVMVDKHGFKVVKEGSWDKSRMCIFEYIYFARSDSVLNGQSVYASRVKAGELLASRDKVEADIVVGVPDSGVDAAIGYSQASGIPYAKGFVKNNYVGRTFIQPTQGDREERVKIKLNVLREAVEGKRVIVIDDSIVRGTTTANIVHDMKAAGAKEVHVRISSLAFKHPCYYGTDVPNEECLIATTHTVEQICKSIGADTLGYLVAEDLPKLYGGRTSFCDACFSGNYPEKP